MFNQKFYLRNHKYSEFLETHSIESYGNLIELVTKYSHKDDKIIDLGCGTGTVIHELRKTRPNILGFEISESSISIAKKKGLPCNIYDGITIPLKSNSVDLVFSNNVLEHVDDPHKFLNEHARILKNNGYMVLICPNFLSITNNYHWHTRGLLRKFLNLISILKLIINNSTQIEKIQVVNNQIFMPDDDACNATNPISIINWAKINNMKLEYWSGQKLKRSGYLWRICDTSYLRSLFGTCILVFRKI